MTGNAVRRAGRLARDFSRRVAVQALVSGTAMLALQVAFGGGEGLQRFVFGDPEPERRQVAASPRLATDKAERLAMPVVVPAAPVPTATAAPDGKPIAEKAPAQARIAQVSTPKPAAPRDVGDVLLFTDCVGTCESRDPLLIRANRPGAPARVVERLTAPDEVAPPRGLLAARAAQGLETAEAPAAVPVPRDGNDGGWLPDLRVGARLGALATQAGSLAAALPRAAGQLLP